MALNTEHLSRTADTLERAVVTRHLADLRRLVNRLQALFDASA